jgi:autotransporter-associated beta strand protein
LISPPVSAAIVGMKKLFPVITVVSLLISTHSFAGSATWNMNPAGSDWNTATNWMPTTVPNGPSDIATFATSTGKKVSFSQETEIDSIIFSPGASAFTISNAPFHPVTISGAGVINNSGQLQKINADAGSGSPNNKLDSPAFPSITFTNGATAGSNITYTSFGGVGELGVGGNFTFLDSSSADHGVFIIHGSIGHYAYPSEISFEDSSTAGNATIVLANGLLEMGALSPNLTTLANATVTNNGGVIQVENQATCGEATILNARTSTNSVSVLSIFGNGSAGSAKITNQGSDGTGQAGLISFATTATADQAVITNEGGDGAGTAGGSVVFGDLNNFIPTAGAATLIANGGTNGGEGGSILLNDGSLGGTARIEVFGNGTLDISGHDTPGVSIGSLEGDGLVSLGTNNLTAGSNNLDTTFSGVIQDAGSLTKLGTARLILTNANTYTGGTTLNGGTLLVNNTTGSGVGTGPVQAFTGILGGSGAISGRVTIGTGRGTGTTLGPGANSVIPGTLTIGKQLALKSDATYRVTLNSNTPAADQVIANGIRIIGAQIVLNELGNTTLPPGTAFTIISNTSNKPINGTFTNLPNGGSITAGNNTFQASYEGGDGNDLTLTVVP